MSSYHTAQICKNGHVILPCADEYTHRRENFCSRCGVETIMECPNCSCIIRGIDSDSLILSKYKAPDYCYHCGQPYPWTQEKLESTQELLALDAALSKDELEYLSSNLNSLLVDTPKTRVVATKFKISLSKLSTVTASAIKDIMIEVASETAKKIIIGC